MTNFSNVVDPVRPAVSHAGEQLASQYAEELRLRILREASRLRPLGIDRAGVNEVQAAIARIKTADRFLPRSFADIVNMLIQRRRFVRLALLATATLAVSFAAIGLLVQSEGRPQLDAGLALVSTLAGLMAGALVTTVTGLVAGLLGTRERQRRLAAVVASHEFVREMAELESEATSVAICAERDNSVGRDLRKVLRTLVNDGIWSTEDLEDYRTILTMRNALVHEETLAVSPRALTFARENIARLSDLLRSAEQGRQANANGSTVPIEILKV